MSRIARKGLSVTLLVCMFAAPIAAAAPMERSGGREEVAVSWVDGLVQWAGEWLTMRWIEIGPDGSDARDGGVVQSMSGAEEGDEGSGFDPNG